MKLQPAFKATDLLVSEVLTLRDTTKPRGLAFAGHRIVLMPCLFSSQGTSSAFDWRWNSQLCIAVYNVPS